VGTGNADLTLNGPLTVLSGGISFKRRYLLLDLLPGTSFAEIQGCI
jgi:hypothetical protein